jgi:hypothetical protein
MIDGKIIWNIDPYFINDFAQNYFADSLEKRIHARKE